MVMADNVIIFLGMQYMLPVLLIFVCRVYSFGVLFTNCRKKSCLVAQQCKLGFQGAIYDCCVSKSPCCFENGVIDNLFGDLVSKRQDHK